MLGLMAGVVAAVGVAACGSSGSSGTSGTSGTTGSAAATGSSLTAFESKANGICTSANAAVKAIPKPTSAADIKRFVDAEYPIVLHAGTQLQALTAPGSERTPYQHYVSVFTQEVAVLRQAKSAADKGDPTAAIGIVNAQGKTLGAQDHAAAEAAHLPSCASTQ